jgi:hypothetical protein
MENGTGIGDWEREENGDGYNNSDGVGDGDGEGDGEGPDGVEGDGEGERWWAEGTSKQKCTNSSKVKLIALCSAVSGQIFKK